MKKQVFILFIYLGISASVSAQLKLSSGDVLPNTAKILRFYPNPAVVAINFDFQRSYSNNKYALSIFNFMGKKVFELKNINARTSINLEEFYRGIYIYQLRDKTGIIIESGKFQVQK